MSDVSALTPGTYTVDAAHSTIGFVARHLMITKVRGRAYPFRRGVLVPTYHPAAVLRGGAEPMAQMRADLVRAKKALGS